MNKIIIEICVGTTCYVMGASELMLIGDVLTDQQKEHVEIKGVTCLDVCHEHLTQKAPFVRINGEIISNVTIEKLIAEIDSRINLLK